MIYNNKIILASKNRGKVEEIKGILKDLNWEILSIADIDVHIELIEDGADFKENSYKKALGIVEATDMVAIADDSGLEVEALHGMPGVHSARFAGEDATDEDNNRKLLSMMEYFPGNERTAKFVCAATVMLPDFKFFTVVGECKGLILLKPRGCGGFGYDSLFYLPEYGKTFAELAPAVKNTISHRAKAFFKIREILSDLGRGMEFDNRSC